MTGIPLRRRLFVLTAAAIVPLALMAGVGLYLLKRQQNAQAERVGLELARSVANAVDAELRAGLQVLETLATTPTLDRDDLEGFRQRAERVIAGRPQWAAIVLADRAGHPVVDTRSTRGPLPPMMDRESFDRVIHTRQAAVGGLNRRPQERWVFAVRVPVLRDGELKYVLSALVRPEAIRDVLTRQQVPSDWVISVVDAHALRVARSRAHEDTLGGRLSETAQHVVDAGGSEGSGWSYALEGERIFTPYSRIPSGGWTAVLGIPTASVDAAVYRSLVVSGGGILLSIGLGTLGALWVARTITRPMAGLRRAAEALGRREAFEPAVAGIQEIRRCRARAQGRR